MYAIALAAATTTGNGLREGIQELDNNFPVCQQPDQSMFAYTLAGKENSKQRVTPAQRKPGVSRQGLPVSAKSL